MKDNVRAHLTAIAARHDWSTEDDTLVEILFEANTVWFGDDEKHRWWILFRRVVEVEGMFIAFTDCKNTGDNSPRDAGWEFDPSTIEEVKPRTRTVEITEYVPVP